VRKDLPDGEKVVRPVTRLPTGGGEALVGTADKQSAGSLGAHDRSIEDGLTGRSKNRGYRYRELSFEIRL
jgi:hypothetical protein